MHRKLVARRLDTADYYEIQNTSIFTILIVCNINKNSGVFSWPQILLRLIYKTAVFGLNSADHAAEKPQSTKNGNFFLVKTE